MVGGMTNPHPFNSREWHIWQQGSDAANHKWLVAITEWTRKGLLRRRADA
jgi:hypothetical protein